MPGFISSLSSAAEAMRVFERALSVVQNNVANASTQGYAKQRLILEAMPFQIEEGLAGGVLGRQLDSTRSSYAEEAVRQRQEAFARADQMAAELGRIELMFDITGEASIPGALSALFQSFSAWSVAPNDTVARRAVIERGRELAERFVETAAGLAEVSPNLDAPIREAVETINALARSLHEINMDYRRDFRNLEDPGLDARVQTTLEQLAEYANVTTVRASDGSLTVLLGGQTPLVIGDNVFEIAADVSGTQAFIRDANGQDITAQITEGRLSALLEVKNTTVPAYMADLNRLATAVADRINAVLAAGVDSNGNPGAPLFAYDSADDAARTLRITGITVAELAAALPAAPGGNGNALNLAALAESQEIDGLTFTGFYGTMARGIGRALVEARQERDTQEQLLMQARSLRNELSGVSLDEEAVRLIEYQRSYQAAAKLITVIQELLETTISLVR